MVNQVQIPGELVGDLSTLDGDMVVSQANDLVEATQSFTLNEKRLLIAMAAKIKPHVPAPKNGLYTLHADDFADVFGMETRHVYEILADAAGRLFNRRIRKIRDHATRKGKRIIEDIRVVWKAVYNEGEGTVTLGPSPDLVPYLSLIHRDFTRYKLRQIGQLGSFYAVRFYELMAQYRNAGDRTISLERLREMLDLGEKYKDVKNLRVRVIDPAIAEINKHTDLRVVVTPQRKGRKVVGFHFDITQDDQIPLDLPEPAHDSQNEPV